MRLDINLATRPYQDAGRFYLQWGALLAGVLVLTLVLAGFAVSAWKQGRAVSRRIEQANQQIASLNHEKEEAEAILQRPGNREVRDRSAFLNTLIARKTFSWTQVFADLEKIMPPRLHVVSITPDLSKDNRLEVHLRVAAESRDTAVDLVRRMEQAPHFVRPEIQQETTKPQSAAGGVEFEIIAQYAPGTQKGKP
ncbi:MAG TPA: PilN domain-containing protein [Terriglobales bacterium]|nr:PilN domain-containing protein [Terriglobales bacterium]